MANSLCIFADRHGVALTQQVRAAETARLAFVIGNRFKRRDRCVSSPSKRFSLIVTCAKRHERTRAHRSRRRGCQHRVRQQCQPGRRFGTAAHIAAAAAQLLVQSGCIDRHGNAGLVTKPAELDRIDGQAEIGSTAIDRADDLGETHREGARGAGQLGGVERGQGSVGRSRREQQFDENRTNRAAILLYGRDVLAIEGPRKSRAGPDIHIGNFEKGWRQHGQGEVEGHVGQANRRQRFGTDEDDLGICGGAVVADQFDPGLGNLSFRRQPRAPHAQALAGVRQAQRARCVGKTGRRDSGNLRGRIGPQTHHPLTIRIHQAERLVGHRGARACQEPFLKLEHWRFDALITMRGEDGHNRLDRCSLGFGVRGEDIA